MKNLKTIIIILVVAGLGFLAYQLSNNKTNSKLAAEALSDFAVKDTASIDKLVMTDTEGNPGTVVVRGEKEWELESGQCIQQHLITTLLETIKYIKVKSPVPKGAIETINKSIAAHHQKMEIYENGKLTKTWYVGNPTQDQYGTYMLLKVEGKGKSPEPYIMHLPNMYGNLSTRFITDPRAFECTEVFAYDPLNIASVEVQLPDSTDYSFKIVANSENSFSLFNNEIEVPNFDTTLVRAYLVGFKKLHFENHNYTYSPTQVDSVLQTNPFYKIKVETKNGETKAIQIYKRKYDYKKYGLDGELLEFDQDRIWVETNEKLFVVGQYHVFGKVMRDIRFFQRR